jgi:hypothetical protein
MFPTVRGVTVGMSSTERLIMPRKTKVAHKIMKEQGKAHGRPRQGFGINAQGFFEPDSTGRQVLAIIRDNPRVRASQVREETGLENYEAWMVLKNCRLYLQEKEKGPNSRLTV